ncbi:MAG: methylmalonyl Co-A mutase-associated GTPase MeaB [Deltaproteobacteria bacterium]|nr:methylmalonyl Co-A mutase-associated GTPase MeaB [Deltaproteobacteria bacterium]MBW2051073.1 methylmalonyl Co-A mutase-associated GTPase MeaB [Deltaproteobacteria bacterium]MBW2141058.1 methylmalonyl Co-A mutase-associated GTPase MeaB [Deltaproteobacteria bacterium]MBW2322584.1 methylmalonyl Co-A mutase-associated GTPase MeaB [Deltaproteobacteria bacterium]
MASNWETLIDEMKEGSIRALTRLITRVENREPGWMEAMKRIFPDTGKAQVIGITGSPGTGKSTLTNRITRVLVDKGFKVGIIAVDPSSPFSGGAILGDRVRMMDVCDLEGVFVRSMATRGALGGLNQSARDVVKLLDAFGKDYILIETVGVGQDEVEVVRTADLVLVVCIPGQGDAVQAIKAGIMEIADIFVVNKADLEGADQVVMDIKTMLDLDMDTSAAKPPIIQTIAIKGDGIQELLEQALVLLKTLEKRALWQEVRVREELIGLVEKEIVGLIKKNWKKDGGLDKAVQQIIAREIDPYTVVQEIITPLVSFLPGE